jgi:cysteine desulfurase
VTPADLVVLQWVNHETGAIAPVFAYAEVCRAQGVPLVVDASQALGKLPCDLSELRAAAAVVTASKIGGPTGAAALWLSRGRELVATSYGGAQERGRRAGTPDVAAHVGFAAAAEQLEERLAAQPRIAKLRNRLEATCVAAGAVVNGGDGPRVATVTNVSVPGWRGEVLVAALDLEGLCASSGAACSSGLGAPSPVLQALYPDQPWRAESALRLSLGPETSDEEVERAIVILRRVLARSPGR